MILSSGDLPGRKTAVNTTIPGTCCICDQTLPGDRVRRHLLQCIESRFGIKPPPAPRRRDRRRNAQRTACLSVRTREQPHWMELGVRCDVTLHQLDRFLRGIWLECCGHVSHFEIRDQVYSVLVPMPGERWRFDPMDDREARWRNMGRTVNAAIPPLTRFGYEHDYGSPTELAFEYSSIFGELVQAVSPSQPWHGEKIVILARNDPLQACLRCGSPALWRAAPEYDEYEEYDHELYDDERVLTLDDLDPITFCEDCAPQAGDLVLLPNSPRVGVNCYDNVHSWGSWPLGDSDDDEW